MINKKIIAGAIFGILAFSNANATVIEVACSTDPVFNQNSCNQCFVGDNKAVGSNIGLLSDKWENNGTKSRIMYRDENSNGPEMISLNGSVWNQIPDVENFWQFTDELNAYYNDDLSGYVLPAGKSVTWLKSSLGYAYNLVDTKASNNQNVGLLIYPLVTRLINAKDDISVDGEEHRECVLYKVSSEDIPEPTPNPEPTPKTKLPQTGPEHILLFAIALLMGLAVFTYIRKKS